MEEFEFSKCGFLVEAVIRLCGVLAVTHRIFDLHWSTKDFLVAAVELLVVACGI